MRIPIRNPKHEDAFVYRPDLTEILHFSPPVPISAPPTQSTHLTKQLAPILHKEKSTFTVSDTSDSDTVSVRRSKRKLKKQNKSLKSPSIVENIQKTEGYSTEMLTDLNFIGEVSPRNPNERWSVDPKHTLPREMTVSEAEERSDSEHTRKL